MSSNTPPDVLRAARKEARLQSTPTVDVKDFVLGFAEGYARACEARNVVRAPDPATAYGRGFAAGWESVARLFNRDTNTNKEIAMNNTLPPCRLVGEDGNVFNVIGRVSRALKLAGQADRANEFTERAFKSESYDAVLRLCMEYVDVS